MKKFSEEELDQKITEFLTGRFNAHPEIKKTFQKINVQGEASSVVSRVKSFSKKVFSTPHPTLYQGR